MAKPLDHQRLSADVLTSTGGAVVPQWRSGFSQASDIQFRELLEQLPAAAYTTDATGLITEPRHPPQRILIVDDNRDAADALAGLLELDGNDVHVAHDGDVALAMAEELRPQVILLDIGLPSLNGYEVAERIRATEWGASILLLALTGWGHPDDRAKTERAGFDEHLIKPVEIDTLTELLAGHAAER
ncbi:MAG: response regulator [Candidatus Limnocylindria bacterium]